MKDLEVDFYCLSWYKVYGAAYRYDVRQQRRSEALAVTGSLLQIW